MEKVILRRTVRGVNGRNGYISSLNRDFKLDMAMPKEMGGVGDDDKTNPEELFAAGYSACFSSSMEYLLQSGNVKYSSLFAEATCKLIKDDEHGGFKFSVIMLAGIAGVDQKTKTDIIHQAYEFCPFSRAIKGNVNVKIVVSEN